MVSFVKLIVSKISVTLYKSFLIPFIIKRKRKKNSSIFPILETKQPR